MGACGGSEEVERTDGGTTLMISELKISSIATFTEIAVMKPLKINFCYGANGGGKTTIANVIADCPDNGAEITWINEPLQTLAYNRNFVEDNFAETSKISGIFTLGKESKEAQEYIAEQRAKVGDCDKQIEIFNNSKKQLTQVQQRRETNIDNTCWTVKGKYDLFSKAGLKGTKKSFRAKCIDAAKTLVQPAPVLDELKRQYGMAFGETRQILPEYHLIDIDAIEKWGQFALLAEKVTGSADTPIGKFIEYLGNSDWVKQGLPHAEKAGDKCPFCQQNLPTNIHDDIRAFFDDSYEQAMTQLRAFGNSYTDKAKTLTDTLVEYANNPITILDYSLFKTETDNLIVAINSNRREIEKKINTPSTAVTLIGLHPVLERVNVELRKFNELITESNDFAKNQKAKQTECINNVWQLIASELKSAVDTYIHDTAGNQAGIKELDGKIDEQKKRKAEHERLIAEKESNLTGVKPTAVAINAILTQFGFEGFSIAENEAEAGTYKIIRSDGQAVEKTLSEGEYNFITFLYFYHLVYGSKDKTGISQSKIVVVDDPISSLDSNILFIVSTLTRQIIDDCENDREGIKQVFIFTHNVYFHKEVTFTGSRKTWKKSVAAFWTVKKNNNVSSIIGYQTRNPIQTSYELLWSELQDTNGTQRITIFNTLRRILEHYFNVIGGLDYEKCINEFDGEDKIICKSLIACINEGSHFITDDFVLQYESGAMDSCIRVFRLIFEKMGHESHYRMMMKLPEQSEENETEAMN
jgi:wobble nucleotide-excising tRNase